MSLERIVTERLQFSRIEPADAAFIRALLNEPGYLQYIGDRGLRTLEDAEAYIRESLVYTDEGLGFYKLLLRQTLEPVGIAGVVKRDFLEEPDLGYALLSGFEGQGLATEAAMAVYDFARNELGMESVGAILSPGNHGSIRVLEKIGMRFIAEVAYPGEDEPIHLYGA